MALQKAITSDFGFDNTYWRLQRLEILRDALTVTITLYGWIDQAARQAGKRPLQLTITVFTPQSAPFFAAIPNVNLETFTYNFLKSNSAEFSGATDV